RSLVSFSILTRFSSFSFTEPATTEIYTLSLHDALPICRDALALFVVNRESRARTETGGRCSRRCRSSNVFRRRRGAPFLRLGNYPHVRHDDHRRRHVGAGGRHSPGVLRAEGADPRAALHDRRAELVLPT